MHCPQCGQQQVSDETRFCSRCGFLLTGVADLVASGGIAATQQTGVLGDPDSPRRRGVKLGLFIFLLSLVIVPVLIMIAIALNIRGFLPIIGLFLLGGGGILRMVYALLFVSGVSSAPMASALSAGDIRSALPPSQAIPLSAFASPSGARRDKNDFQLEPGSVTDSTTKLLQRDE